MSIQNNLLQVTEIENLEEWEENKKSQVLSVINK